MTGPGPVLSARQTADLFKRVQNGEAVKALAREVGVSHTTILRSFSRYGHRRNRWKEPEVALVGPWKKVTEK